MSWDPTKHGRGYHGRFSVSKGIGGGEKSAIPKATLGRPTRTARLKSAATRHHNEKLSAKIVAKGTAVTPVEAGMRKARRLMGTQPARPKHAAFVIPEEHAKSWVRVDWSKISGKRRIR